MIRIAIVDDEITVLEGLAEKVKAISYRLNMEIQLETFLNGNDLIKRNHENEFHIIMLDLEMPELDGLSAAKILRAEYPEFILIFITNRSDLVFQSFAYDVTGFIRKNHMDDELPDTLNRAYQKILSRMTNYVFRTENGERVFPTDSICYIISKGHQVLLFDDAHKPTRILSTLEKMEQQLSPSVFVRCHSGIIINCKYIFSINKADIELTDKQKLPLSRYRAKAVKEVFQKYLRSI